MHETLTFVDLLDTGNAQAHLILLSIARHANWDKGTSWASQETLARMSKCTERTVRTYLARLEQDGFITRSERRDERGTKLNDEITLVGYADWIKSLREGGRVERPREVARYHLPENLSGGLPENLGGVTGKQLSGIKEQYKNSITTTKAVVESTQEGKVLNFDLLQSQLLDAADPCLDNPANCSGLLNLSIPQIWITHGCDLEQDILPTLRALAQRAKGKRIRTWGYFTEAVLEARTKRETTLKAISSANENKPLPKNASSWVKIQSGTPLFDQWLEVARKHGKYGLISIFSKTGTLVVPPGDPEIAWPEFLQQTAGAA